MNSPDPGFGGSFVKMNPDCVRLNVRFELVGADGVASHVRKSGRAGPVSLLSI